MKFVLFLYLVVSVCFASNNFKVVDIGCGDFDQYHVGEVCVLTLQKASEEITLIIDLYEYLALNDYRSQLLEQTVTINTQGLKRCTDEAYYEIRLDREKNCLWVPYGDVINVIEL